MTSSPPLIRAASNLAGIPLLLLAFAEAGFAQFVDETLSSGLFRQESSWGAILQDLDGDGSLDLFTGHHFINPAIYQNDGSALFDSTLNPQWLTPSDRHGVVILPLDDNELREIFVLHGGGGGAGAEGNELFADYSPGGSFSSISVAAGIADPNGRSRAVSAADYNDDGLVDLWVGKAPDPFVQNSLFRNDGSLTFTDVADAVGLDEGEGTVGGLWADTDDDGDPDLLVGGEEFVRPTILFRNDGGSFVDASSNFSPSLPVVSGADFGDYDNDGDLDLAVCGGHLGVFDTFENGDTLTYFFNSRFQEDGVDGVTVPVTGAGQVDSVWARARIRGDDDLSLVFLGPGEVNPQTVPFVITDAHVGAPTLDPGVDRGTWIWRKWAGGPIEVRCSTPELGPDAFDGWFTRGFPIIGGTPHNFEISGFAPTGPRLWRNDGGTFVEVTGIGLTEMLNPRDLSWVDYDNDGDLDLHVVDMGTSAAPNAPDALFRNDGGTFVDVAKTEGCGGGIVGLADGAVWGDVDADGDLDVFVQQGAGPKAFSLEAETLFLKNEGSHGNSIQIDLVGTESPVSAIGARVSARIGSESIPRRVFANSWRSFQDPLRVHLGIGHVTEVDSLVIDWPSRNQEVFTSVPPGIYRLVEDRLFDRLHVLTVSPDTVTINTLGTVLLEMLKVSGARLARETSNLRMESLTGVLTPLSAGENPDTTYSFRYQAPAIAGIDTLVVRNVLTNPVASDSVVIVVSDDITSVDPIGPSADLTLEGIPNPFSRSCRVRFAVPHAAPVAVTVHDVRGRLVRVLAQSPHESGRHVLDWDGLDSRGRATPSGVYFLRLRVGARETVSKLVRIH